LDFDRLHHAARQPFRRGHGFYGLSMFAFPGELDAEEVARLAPIPNSEICETTAGEIWGVMFDVRRTFRKRGHFSLIFPSEPSDDDIRTAMQLLEPCRDNPHKKE
jgi:hypothetical protein